MKKPKSKFQIDYEYLVPLVRDARTNLMVRDPARAGQVIGCDIMAYSEKQALFLFERKHPCGVYKILQVTNWGVPEYLKGVK